MNDILKSKINTLPTKPGIYQYFNLEGKVIYVGKAINLRSRVKSYFINKHTAPRTISLVKRIEDLEVIVVDNEIEALVLENTLIKKFKPKYNVVLKDDKSFPFIKVTKELYPRIYATRNVVTDDAKYFGPYTDVRSMKSSLKMINTIFKIRSCRLSIDKEGIEKKRFKICLDYHIKKCDGPCEGLISETHYSQMVEQVSKLLKGKTEELIKDLTNEMNFAITTLSFEKAAELRDRIFQIKSFSEKQKVVSEDKVDRDIIGVASEGKDTACSIFIIREGKLIGKKQLRLANTEGEELEAIYSVVIKRYYSEFTEIPDEILLDIEPTDFELLKKWLAYKSGKKVKIFIPQRGDLKSLINLNRENAVYQLKELQIAKMKRESNIPHALYSLQRDLRLKKIPLKIECFDISNLSGTDTVASMVVFVEGKPKKSLYRKYIINTVDGPNDFESMREVISRRYSRAKEENEPIAELIMVDGGKGQLSSAVAILKSLGYENYNIVGLAKRLEEIFFPGESEPLVVPKTSSSLKLLQNIRDEAHRFAITFHRQRRSKRTFISELTSIEGIGDKTAEKLLKKIGSVNKVKKATIDELKKVVGAKAENIIKYFENNS